MFAAIVEADTLRSTIDSVAALVDECKIHLNADGLQVRAVDPANVGMVDAQLDAAAFESYEADSGVIGVDLSRVQDVLKLADAGQLVHLELNPETRKLEIEIGSLDYTLALIDPESIRQEPDIPDLDLPAEVVVEGKDVNRAVKAADLASDHIAFGVDEADEVFYVEAEGDVDDVRQEFDADEVIDFTPGAAHSLYSLDYVKDYNKAIASDAEVRLRLGEEFPFKLSFDYAEGQGSVEYMLAPRIQSE